MLVSLKDPSGSRRLFLFCQSENLRKKIVTFMRYSNDIFHYTFKAEPATHENLKAPSGNLTLTLAKISRIGGGGGVKQTAE